MRGLILGCAILASAYWVDQTFYSGTYARAVAQVLDRIGHSFR